MKLVVKIGTFMREYIQILERQNQYDVQSYRKDKMKCTEFLESGLCESTRKSNAFLLIIQENIESVLYENTKKDLCYCTNYLGKYRI